MPFHLSSLPVFNLQDSEQVNKALKSILDPKGHIHLTDKDASGHVDLPYKDLHKWVLPTVTCDKCRDKIKDALDKIPEPDYDNMTEEELDHLDKNHIEVYRLFEDLDEKQLMYRLGKYITLRSGIDLADKTQVENLVRKLRKRIEKCSQPISEEVDKENPMLFMELEKEKSKAEAVIGFINALKTKERIIGDEGYINSHRFEG